MRATSAMGLGLRFLTCGMSPVTALSSSEGGRPLAVEGFPEKVWEPGRRRELLACKGRSLSTSGLGCLLPVLPAPPARVTVA